MVLKNADYSENDKMKNKEFYLLGFIFECSIRFGNTAVGQF